MKIKNPFRFSSLRSVLITWFFVFSILPLVLISWYSLRQFQQAIESEQLQRLQSNGREVAVIVSDYYQQLKNNQEALASSAPFTEALVQSNRRFLKDFSYAGLSLSFLNSASLYAPNGQKLIILNRDRQNNLQSQFIFSEDQVLNAEELKHLVTQNELGTVVESNADGLTLVLISKFKNQDGDTQGYIEQRIDLKSLFLMRVKNKIKSELFLLDNSQHKVLASTFLLSNTDIHSLVQAGQSLHNEDQLLNIKNQDTPYGFIIQPLLWDKSVFFLGIGMNKKGSLEVLQNINVAFIGVISLVALFLIITIVISTTVLLRPINELIEGLQAFDKTEKPIQLAVKNKTEIGRLTRTFNQMSYKIYSARQDLRKKIKELEKANMNLKAAQAKLVHSAKMTSLGQLVAGVAHELNNPIGFIYSNTAHLKDYSEKLFKIIDEIEKKPEKIGEIKQAYDYEYIKKDLPQLIRSCEDGAQRTRDIVVGLRNFSRLDESQLKEVDLREALDTTLEILSGELKNRIKIIKNYEEVPRVWCYASQINQVLVNILANAAQAIEGNGRIWIHLSTQKATAETPRYIRLSIQDSGAGIPREVVEKIFEPFFTTKDVGQGTGLGLSISYGIVQNHGGDIQVKSQVGKGTEFIVTLPLKPPLKSSPTRLKMGKTDRTHF